MSNVIWLKQPQDHDYPAAADYLVMLAGPDLVSRLIGELHAATPEHKKAKDILRAARLTLLPTDNPHVASDLSKIKKGQPLSPILLVGGDLTTGLALQIVDGYHRVCASYYTDEDTDIPVLIAATR
jgi:hypothetical protein